MHAKTSEGGFFSLNNIPPSLKWFISHHSTELILIKVSHSLAVAKKQIPPILAVHYLLAVFSLDGIFFPWIFWYVSFSFVSISLKPLSYNVTKAYYWLWKPGLISCLFSTYFPLNIIILCLQFSDLSSTMYSNFLYPIACIIPHLYF